MWTKVKVILYLVHYCTCVFDLYIQLLLSKHLKQQNGDPFLFLMKLNIKLYQTFIYIC